MWTPIVWRISVVRVIRPVLIKSIHETMWNGWISSSCKGYLNISLTAVRFHKSLQCIFIIFTHIIPYMKPALKHSGISKDKIEVLVYILKEFKIPAMNVIIIRYRQQWSPLKCFQEVFVSVWPNNKIISRYVGKINSHCKYLSWSGCKFLWL